jgi:hypothetical protein
VPARARFLGPPKVACGPTPSNTLQLSTSPARVDTWPERASIFRRVQLSPSATRRFPAPSAAMPAGALNLASAAEPSLLPLCDEEGPGPVRGDGSGAIEIRAGQIGYRAGGQVDLRGLVDGISPPAPPAGVTLSACGPPDCPCAPGALFAAVADTRSALRTPGRQTCRGPTKGKRGSRTPKNPASICLRPKRIVWANHSLWVELSTCNQPQGTLPVYTSIRPLPLAWRNRTVELHPLRARCCSLLLGRRWRGICRWRYHISGTS